MLRQHVEAWGADWDGCFDIFLKILGGQVPETPNQVQRLTTDQQGYRKT